jgi:hypothetical protein
MGRGAHTRKPVITPQQKRAVELFKQNILAGGTKSFQDILLEAGYSEETARQQVNVMAGIKPHLQDFITEMEEHRKVVIEKMKTRIDSASYSDLVTSLDKLTKNIQLLGGKPTGNFVLTEERRKELEAIADGE